jgi:protein SCO1
MVAATLPPHAPGASTFRAVELGVRLRFIAGLVGLLPAFLLAQTVSQIATSPGTMSINIDRANVRLEQRLGAQIPLDATFRDETGKSQHFGELIGNKPSVILPIFFLCKGVCGLELQGTIAALKGMTTRKLGHDFNIVVMSIHPKETPELAEGKYKSTVDEVGLPGTENGWRFVVGDLANIHRVTNAIGFKYTYDEEKNAINHPSGIVFVTPKGVVSSYIYGAQYTPKQFERNLDFAGREQVGAKTEEIFFGCIHVDPLTGRRSFVVQNILKVAGIFTVGVLVLAIAVLSGKASLRRRRMA